MFPAVGRTNPKIIFRVVDFPAEIYTLSLHDALPISLPYISMKPTLRLPYFFFGVWTAGQDLL